MYIQIPIMKVGFDNMPHFAHQTHEDCLTICMNLPFDINDIVRLMKISHLSLKIDLYKIAALLMADPIGNEK